MNLTKIPKIMIGHIHTLQKKPKQLLKNKPPVLLLHGAWHGAWCWEGNYLDYFAEAGHETWAMDLSGHGESGKKKPLRFTTVDDFLADITSVIEAMPQPPIIIGHSMGGLLCQHVLNDNPNVRGVGFLASLPSAGVVGIKLTVHPLKKLQSNLTLSLYPLVSSRKNAKYMFLETDADEATVDHMMARLGNEAWLAFVGIATGKSLPKAPEIPLKTPACVVAAGGDTIVPVELQEQLAERFGLKAHVIPDAPHDLMLAKNWDDSARVFLDWIGSLDCP